MTKYLLKLRHLNISVFFYLLASTPTVAQIVPDATLPVNSVVTPQDSTNLIEGGTKAGSNLFHSFSQFDITTGSTAFFNNAADITNIFSRITGGSASYIDGILKSNNTANLFLINPNGIIFGENASLNIAGSFFATTANSIEFGDRTIFTTNPNTPAILTISVPLGLGFGSTPGTIINQSKFAVPGIPTPVGLAVPPGKTLALIGGDIFLNGGVITASGGRIQLGSVQSPSKIYLTPDAEGWAIDYRDVPNFGNIQLSQAAEVITYGSSGGEIIVQAAKLRLTERSHLISVTQGAESGRGLTINATDAVEIIGDGKFLEEIFNFASGNFVLADSPTGLFSFSVGSGSGGDIVINTNSFLGKNSAVVFSSTLGAGNVGNLTLNATTSVEVDAGNLFAGTGVLATGHAGNLTINTSYLKFLNNGFASTTNLGNGQAGNLNVNATESIELIGKDIIILPNGYKFTTGIFTSSFGSKDSGNLSVDTKRLIISNGAAISAYSHTQGGNVTITTKNLEIYDTAYLSARGELRGGNIEINTNDINLNDRAFIASESGSGEGGNIQIKTSRLQLDRNSRISTTAGLDTGTGNGGNIDITTDTLVALENSRIIANAFQGNGGNVTIQTQGNFFSPDSTLSASSKLGVNGTVQVNTPSVDPSSGLTQLPSTPVDVSGLVAQSCSANGGEESQLAVTGRGGLPPNPTEVLTGETGLVDLATPSTPITKSPEITPEPISIKTQPQLIEATGWSLNSKGEVILVANASKVTSHSPWQSSQGCNGKG